MGWTVIMEGEHGNLIKQMPGEFILSNPEKDLNDSRFKLLKYLDPYGDTTFNKFMFNDLIEDLIILKELLPGKMQQIDLVISYAAACNNEIHTYLKFYGD